MRAHLDSSVPSTCEEVLVTAVDTAANHVLHGLFPVLERLLKGGFRSRDSWNQLIFPRVLDFSLYGLCFHFHYGVSCHPRRYLNEKGTILGGDHAVTRKATS